MTDEVGRLRGEVDVLLSEHEEREKAKNPPVDWASLSVEQAAEQWPILARWIEAGSEPPARVTRPPCQIATCANSRCTSSPIHRRAMSGPGSRAAGLAMAFKLIEAAQDRWRAVNGPHLVALVRAGATFEAGKLAERPAEHPQPEAA